MAPRLPGSEMEIEREKTLTASAQLRHFGSQEFVSSWKLEIRHCAQCTAGDLQTL